MLTGATSRVEGFSEISDQQTSVSGGPEGLRYIARQPILDYHGNLYAYELLFRAGASSSGFTGDENTATRTMLDNTLVFGLEKLTGGLPAFVNCTREALVDRLALVLPSGNIVLEILETIKPDDDLLAACKDFKAKGFRLALDDFAWTPEWHRFIPLVDFIKVDLSITTPAERRLLRAKLGGSHAVLLAERVETHADLEMARTEGFTFFQGYFFCRPVVMENRAIPSNRLIHLQMLQATHEHPLNIGKIAELVKRDASLTYRLLRLVNSPLYGTRQGITSIHGALVMIGDCMFRRVATLAIAAELKGDHPTELLQMAFARGRFCELLAPSTRQDPTEQYLLGILSLLPAMLNVEMENVVAALPLREGIRKALLGNEGTERRALDWLIANESGAWARCDEIALEAGFEHADLFQKYTDALLWAETNLSLTMK